MVEFWACLGLGCTDKEFLDKLIDPSIIGKSTVGDVVKEYGFRLSHFELAELERILGHNESIVELMMRIQVMICPPPPRACPDRSASSQQTYEEYKRVHASILRRPAEKS